MKFLGSIVKGDGWIGKIYKLNKIKFDLLNLQSIDINKYPYLLESSSRGNKKNRYSILFFKPKVLLQKTKKDKKNFLNEFDIIWKREKIHQSDFYFNNKKIPFCGGWFVYLGYELVEEIEPRLTIPKSPFKLPTAFASRVNTAILFSYFIINIYLFNFYAGNVAPVGNTLKSNIINSAVLVGCKKIAPTNLFLSISAFVS